MAQQKKIIDASVAVKWFSREEGSVKALVLRDEHCAGKTLLVIPELLFLEVTNALRYKQRTLIELQEANAALWNLQMHVEKISQFLLEKAIEVALKNKLTVYDALYVAISLLHGSSLITADTALKNLPNVVLL